MTPVPSTADAPVAVPDPTEPEWSDAMDKAPVRRGRPKSPAPKVATTIRLDLDVIEHFWASGSDWQTRINEVLRRAAGLQDRYFRI